MTSCRVVLLAVIRTVVMVPHMAAYLIASNVEKRGAQKALWMDGRWVGMAVMKVGLVVLQMVDLRAGQ